MNDIVQPLSERDRGIARRIWDNERVWLLSALLLGLIALVDPAQGAESLAFLSRALLNTAPYLLLSIGLAAYASATGADSLIARAFTGAPVLMIALAAAVGAVSPFCSCGVIPLIAALLTMGVPLSAVMAFWLASPVMDPSMFALTSGILGLEFASAKAIAALGLGLFGGYATLLLSRTNAFSTPLRDGVGAGGCCAAPTCKTERPVWAFWREQDRRAQFARSAVDTSLFLFKWLTLAFLLESIMVAYVPAEWVVRAVGGEGLGSIALATLVGVPAYLNGYAALPLVSGLIDQGMTPGAGMAFLVAGGVTSLPAALAVWALARPHVFALYLGLALTGSFAAGVLFQATTGA